MKPVDRASIVIRQSLSFARSLASCRTERPVLGKPDIPRRIIRFDSRGECNAVRLATVGRRAFSVVGARVWNDLPADVTSAPKHLPCSLSENV